MTGFGVVSRLASPGHHWVDIIDISEFKKSAEKGREVMFGMHHVLDSYMNRSLVFGTTIARRQTRFWKMSREGLVTTEPIDFHTEALLFIEHTARLAYASTAQLGIDDTAALTQDKERIATISINKETYFIVRTLFQHPAHNICSRAARICG
ncbi:hypothetical protein DACRYDRAFT_21892 [Dacryopinax primogenitus]|uniref:Fungal-type protein kinase domain-containing protein n=1 Tax=Dacryopinax primogenitus (strain DJM 731) TaxID=1858805 RepID=M5G042_DACPD|nr:uncharacterized protein DACRYDRAFT_21892 [Dacryopinax primogenitus]EJU02119.1 hypothetical protein DACRYDRAFT_21892 [Dacryopinax primogenitus]